MKREIGGLVAQHSAFHSRFCWAKTATPGSTIEKLPAVEWPLVRVHPRSRRKLLFVGAHCIRILA